MLQSLQRPRSQSTSGNPVPKTMQTHFKRSTRPKKVTFSRSFVLGLGLGLFHFLFFFFSNVNVIGPPTKKPKMKNTSKQALSKSRVEDSEEEGSIQFEYDDDPKPKGIVNVNIIENIVITLSYSIFSFL